jgi:hypothetical protein
METTGNIHDLESALVDIVKFIDPKYKWLARNGDGDFALHAGRPKIAPNYRRLGDYDWWVSEGDEEVLPLTLPYDGDWKESLINLEEVRGNE